MLSTPTRRDFLRAMAASIAAAGAAGCQRRKRAPGEASLWFAYGGKNREVLLSLVDEFHLQHPHYRIHATYQGDYFESLAKLRTAIAARAAPSITHVVGEVLPYLAEAGVLERLDGGSQGLELKHELELDLVPELAQAKGYIDGDRRPLWGLPFNRSTPIAYYNKTMFAELGLAPPRTWQELLTTARAATRRDASGAPQIWGFECPIDWWFWVALVGQAGGAVFDEHARPTLGGEAGERALDFWQNLVHRERIMKPPPGRDYNAWQATNTDFLAGRAAMIWTSTAFLRYLENNAKFEVGAAPLPSDHRASVPVGGTLFVIPKGIPDQEKEVALAFLRWMMQPAQAVAWATRTGYIPISRGGIQDLEHRGYYREHPNDRVAIAELAHVSPWPWAPDLFRVQREAVQPRLEEAVLKGRDARETLAEARRAALDP